jgi:hypothetical protein
MFIPALFTMTRCNPRVHLQMNGLKMWHVHVVECNSALKGRKFRYITPINEPSKYYAV